jgi:hypothetical protein
MEKARAGSNAEKSSSPAAVKHTEVPVYEGFFTTFFKTIHQGSAYQIKPIATKKVLAPEVANKQDAEPKKSAETSTEATPLGRRRREDEEVPR